MSSQRSWYARLCATGPRIGVMVKALFIAFLNSNISIFRLHYSFTPCMVLFFALLNLFKSIFGNPLICISDSSLNDIIDDYCWNTPSHTIPHPVFNATGQYINKEHSEGTNYYQKHRWIFPVLVFQAVCFYLPYCVAKISEGDLIQIINPNSARRTLNENQTEENKEPSLELKKPSVHYFVSNLNAGRFGAHSLYAHAYILCEVLNFGNVILQLYLINCFFFGKKNNFADLNSICNLMENPRNRTDSLAISLPQFTKCEFNKPGPGGTDVPYYAECVIAVNSTNQLTVAFLSYWFSILIILSVLALVSRCIVRFSPQMRNKILKARSQPPDEKQTEERERTGKQSDIYQKCHYGDWFVLYQLKKHCDSFSYREFVHELNRKVN